MKLFNAMVLSLQIAITNMENMLTTTYMTLFIGFIRSDTYGEDECD